MKKFITALFTVCAITIFASEAEVRKICREYHQKIVEFKIDEVLYYLHPEYSETSSEGKKLSITDAENIANIASKMKKACRDDSSLLEIMEVINLAQGKTISDDMKKNIRDMANSDAGKKQTNLLRSIMKAALDQQIRKYKNSVNSLKIINAKVEGNNASLIFQMKSATNEKNEEYTWKLVKVSGKWLIVNSVARYF